MGLTQVNSEGIKDGEIKNADMADDAVGVAELSATGTASSSTFLRGDNSWATPTDTNTQVGGATGVDFNDDVKARFGTGNDLAIYHNGNDSFITHNLAGSGNNLHIEAANSIQFGNVGTSEVLAQMVPNGACTLWYDNVKRFETTSAGSTVSGGGLIATNSSEGYVEVRDERGADYKAKFLMAGSAPVIRNENTSTSDNTFIVQKGGNNKFAIDGNGYVTKPNQPAFRAGRDSGSLSVNAGDSIIFNSASMAGGFNQGSHYDTSNGRFTAPVTGVYHFHACVIWEGLGTGTVDMTDAFKFFVNTTQISFSEKRAKYENNVTGTSGYFTDSATCTTYLQANDYIWCRNSYGSKTVHANATYCHFSGHLVG